jgi:hypothetical protein
MQLQVTLIKVTDVSAAARVLSAVAVALLTVSCPGWRTTADLLWLPDDAHIEPNPMTLKVALSSYSDGGAGVVFTMDRPDREELTRELIAHFETAGWRQRAHQWLNPHLATSFRAGWRGTCGCLRLVDAHGKPLLRERQYEWIGEWEDPHGNVIEYRLMARGTRIRGSSSYSSHRIIGRMTSRLGS